MMQSFLMLCLSVIVGMLVHEVFKLVDEVRELRRDVRGDADDIEGALQARLADASVREQQLRGHLSEQLGVITSLRVQLQMERAARGQQQSGDKQQ